MLKHPKPGSEPFLRQPACISSLLLSPPEQIRRQCYSVSPHAKKWLEERVRSCSLSLWMSRTPLTWTPEDVLLHLSPAFLSKSLGGCESTSFFKKAEHNITSLQYFRTPPFKGASLPCPVYTINVLMSMLPSRTVLT